MSRGQVGKRAASDMAADLIIVKILDFVAIFQPRLWERMRQLVIPHLTLAQGGMAAVAEVVALLKDNLTFLPAWVHRVIDTGLAQSPMTIVSYFQRQTGPQSVVARLGGSLDHVGAGDLGPLLEHDLINSPEFRQLVADAEFGRMMRGAQVYLNAAQQEISKGLQGANELLGDLNTRMAATNARRRTEIAVAREKRANREQLTPWWKMLPAVVTMVFCALTLLISIGFIIAAHNAPPPEVVIESAEHVDGGQWLELTGSAQAGSYVTRIEIQVDHGPRMPVKIWSAKTVHWSKKIRPPSSRATITVYAHDPREKVPGVAIIEVDGYRTR